MTIVFNGEIYNFRALAAQLAKRGVFIRGNSDGSVLVPLYLEYGNASIDMLDGMFAIAIIDTRDGLKLALHVDHLAVKSVYYASTSQGFVFASEIRALSELLEQPPAMDPSSVDLFFEAQCMPPENGFLTGVQRLAAGQSLYTDGDRIEIRQRRTATTATLNDPSSAGLATLLQDEVFAMCRQGSKVAVQLSGGLDSALLLSMLSARRSDVTAFHVSFDDGSHPLDERRYAIDAAQHAQVPLEVVEISWRSLPELLPRVVGALGAPNATPHAVSAFVLFEEISRQGFRVCFTGDGADEQLGGYRRYSRALQDQSPSWETTYLDRLSLVPEQEYRSLYTKDYAKLIDEKGTSRSGTLARFRVPAPGRLEQLLRFDRYVKLPSLNLQKLDHLSMAHGIEGRVPYCQASLTRFAEALPDHLKVDGDRRKRILWEAGSQFIPESISRRSKQPFTLPVKDALQPGMEMWVYLRETLFHSTLVDQGILDRAAVADLLVSHEGGFDKSTLLWGLLVLELAASAHGALAS